MQQFWRILIALEGNTGITDMNGVERGDEHQFYSGHSNTGELLGAVFFM